MSDQQPLKEHAVDSTTDIPPTCDSSVCAEEELCNDIQQDVLDAVD